MATLEQSSNDKCIFCKIAAGKEPKTTILYENDEFVIFKDIKPASKHHYLVIPKNHVKNPKLLQPGDIELVERLISVGKEYLVSIGVDSSTSRFGFHWPPFNSVNHLHLHIISPVSEMGWLASVIFKPGTLWFVTADWLLNRLRG